MGCVYCSRGEAHKAADCFYGTNNNSIFSDNDLRDWKTIKGLTEKEKAFLARLEAAEQVIVDIAYPDHGFFNEMGFRKTHYEAWRRSAGKDSL